MMRAITFVCASVFYTHAMWGHVSAVRVVTHKATEDVVDASHHSLSDPGHEHEKEHEHENEHDHEHDLKHARFGGAQERAPALWMIRSDGLCIDQNTDKVSNWGPRRNNVYGHRCHGGNNQRFYFRNGRIHNLHSGSGWCLDMSLEDGSLYMNTCHGGWNQHFYLSGMEIRNRNGCVDRHNETYKYNLYIHPCNGRSNQHFEIGGFITVSGKWQYLQALQKETKYTMEHGTTKTQDVTKSSEWASSVTASVSTGFWGLSAGVSAMLGPSLATSHQREWSVNQESSARQSFEFVQGKQMYLWQWQYEIGTTTAETVTTKTQDYALTAGRWEKPKCAPGYCIDEPRCQACVWPGQVWR